VKRYGKCGRNVGWIVIIYEKYGRKPRYGKCGRKVEWIVKRYEKYGRKVGWIVKHMENVEENQVE
jgi:hypothetical protein